MLRANVAPPQGKQKRIGGKKIAPNQVICSPSNFKNHVLNHSKLTQIKSQVPVPREIPISIPSVSSTRNSLLPNHDFIRIQVNKTYILFSQQKLHVIFHYWCLGDRRLGVELFIKKLWPYDFSYNNQKIIELKTWDCFHQNIKKDKQVIFDLPNELAFRPSYSNPTSFIVKDNIIQIRGWIVEKSTWEWSQHSGNSYDNAIGKHVVDVNILSPLQRPWINLKPNHFNSSHQLLHYLKNEREELTCQCQKETINHIESPISLTTHDVGLLRGPRTLSWSDDHLQNYLDFNDSPTFTISFWIYVLEPCSKPSCSIFSHLATKNREYLLTPLIYFLKDSPFYHIQIAISNNSAHVALITPIRVVYNKWVRVVFAFSGLYWQLVVSTRHRDIDGHYKLEDELTEYTYPITTNITYDDTVGIFVYGGHELMPSFRGFIGQATFYQTRFMPHESIPMPSVDHSMWNIPDGAGTASNGWKKFCSPYQSWLFQHLSYLFERLNVINFQSRQTLSSKQKDNFITMVKQIYPSKVLSSRHNKVITSRDSSYRQCHKYSLPHSFDFWSHIISQKMSQIILKLLHEQKSELSNASVNFGFSHKKDLIFQSFTHLASLVSQHIHAHYILITNNLDAIVSARSLNLTNIPLPSDVITELFSHSQRITGDDNDLFYYSSHQTSQTNDTKDNLTDDIGLKLNLIDSLKWSSCLEDLTGSYHWEMFHHYGNDRGTIKVDPSSNNSSAFFNKLKSIFDEYFKDVTENDAFKTALSLLTRRKKNDLKLPYSISSGDSMFTLSSLLSSGFGRIPVDLSLSRSLLLRCATLRNRLCLLALGNKFIFGTDGFEPVDFEMAYLYFKSLVSVSYQDRLEHKEEGAYLDVIHLNDGEALASLTDPASDMFQYLQGQAGLGENDAQRDLARLFFWGSQGVPRDIIKAAEYYRLAAENEDEADEVALYDYAIILIKGQGVQKDIPKGIRLLKKSAARNFALAYNALGWVYMDVIGNMSKAIPFFEKAHDLGNTDASHNLAYFHYNGYFPNGTKNWTRAYELFSVGAEGGSKESQAMIAHLNMRGIPPDFVRDTQHGSKWARYIAEQNPIIARFVQIALQAFRDQRMLSSLYYYFLTAHTGIEVSSFNAAYLFEEEFLDLTSSHDIFIDDTNTTLLRHQPDVPFTRDPVFRMYNQSLLGREDHQITNYALIKMGDYHLLSMKHRVDVIDKSIELDKAARYYYRAAIKGDPQGYHNLGSLVENNLTISTDIWQSLGIPEYLYIIPQLGVEAGQKFGDDIIPSRPNYELADYLYSMCAASDENAAFIACSITRLKVKLLHFNAILSQLKMRHWCILAFTLVCIAVRFCLHWFNPL